MVESLKLGIEAEKKIGTILPSVFLRVIYGMSSGIVLDYMPNGFEYLSEEEFAARFEEIEKMYGSCLGKQSFDFVKVTKRMVFAKYS